jgi:hypothetical protein
MLFRRGYFFHLFVVLFFLSLFTTFFTIKSLLGLDDEVVLQYLRRVEVRKDAKTISETVKMEKRRGLLQEIFMQRTGCSTWEEAETEFFSHVHVVDEFLGKLFTIHFERKQRS